MVHRPPRRQGARGVPPRPVRHREDGEWYIVRHDARGRAAYRRGPFRTTQDGANELERTAAGADDGDGEGIESCDLAERVVREGLAERIRGAALRWVQAVDAAMVTEAAAGNGAPSASGFHEVTDPESTSGGTGAEDARSRFRELIEATERWRTWHDI